MKLHVFEIMFTNSLIKSRYLYECLSKTKIHSGISNLSVIYNSLLVTMIKCCFGHMRHISLSENQPSSNLMNWH